MGLLSLRDLLKSSLHGSLSCSRSQYDCRDAASLPKSISGSLGPSTFLSPTVSCRSNQHATNVFFRPTAFAAMSRLLLQTVMAVPPAPLRAGAPAPSPAGIPPSTSLNAELLIIGEHINKVSDDKSRRHVANGLANDEAIHGLHDLTSCQRILGGKDLSFC